jgi:hypothetical protein
MQNKRGSMMLAGLFVILLLGVSDLALAQKKTFTAQSGMLTIDLPQASFVVIDNFTYQYDRTCAEGFFTCNKVLKTWIGSEVTPNSTCSGTPTSASPSADNGSLQQLITDNKCPFFNGTSLTDTQTPRETASPSVT